MADSTLDDKDKEEEEEPATKEISIQCDLYTEFVEEEVLDYECNFLGLSEKETQLTSTRITHVKVSNFTDRFLIAMLILWSTSFMSEGGHGFESCLRGYLLADL